MKQRLESKGTVWGITAGAIGCILLGFLLISTAFNNYHNHVRENVDRRLFQLTEAVDSSLESYLGRYMNDVIHATGHEELRKAEQIWLEGGNEEVWMHQIRKSLFGVTDEFSAVLLMDENQVLISTERGKRYYFPQQEEIWGNQEIRPCLDTSGKVYLAFVKEMEQGLRYAALVDFQTFYHKVVGNVTGENQVLLLDRYGQMLIYHKNGMVQVDRVEELKENSMEYETVSALQKQQAPGSLFFDNISYSTGESYQARMVIVPEKDAGNGYFHVGVSINYDKEVQPLKMAAILMAASGLVLLIGMAILFVVLMQTIEKSQSSQEEIRILQEKNAAMEELNRQTRELAHHQRLEMMGMLTSGIAHEFNNMLTPIMGYSMMILEKLPQEDSELYDEVLAIYQMSSKAKTVISRLSDLSRKNTETVFKRVPIDELVRRMISAAKSARPNDVDVQLELKCPEAAVYGNETQLSQLLLNLIINSYHALEATGGTLEILTEVKDNEVVLKVRDDGYGISKEHLPHIFEPFFTTKETGKGTGLGMAIVAQVVEDHHGRIMVESEEGKGTEMTVIFPKMEEKTEES